MNIEKIARKVEERIMSPSLEDLCTIKFDEEVSKMAHTCLTKKALVDGALDPTSVTSLAASTGGGAGIGALAGALIPAREEGEDEESYKKRRRNAAITGGLAGASIGGSLPFVVKGIDSINSGMSSDQGILSKIFSTVAAPAAAIGSGVWLGGIKGGLTDSQVLKDRRAQTDILDKMTKNLGESTAFAQNLKNFGEKAKQDEFKAGLKDFERRVLDQRKIVEGLTPKSFSGPVELNFLSRLPKVQGLLKSMLNSGVSKKIVLNPTLLKFLSTNKGKSTLGGAALAGLLYSTIASRGFFGDKS